MKSIKDVAALAGVSVKTVSRILSGFEGVSVKTKEKVEQAMKELEYYPSAAAQSLKGVGSGIVSLITDNLTTTPYSYGIVAGIQDVCEKNGLLLMIGETGGKMSNFGKLVEDFRRQRSQAIILATVFHKEVKITQTFKRCPLILVNCFEKETSHPTILPDDEQGSFDATCHLIEQGHRRIAALTLSNDIVATGLRLTGYKMAHKKHNLVVDTAFIHEGVCNDENDEYFELEGILRRMMASPTPPTAIMCGNDKMAMRVFMLIRGVMGYKIPEQVSIVGYDNYQMLAENLVPKLSTVNLPYFRMGQLAAELAISKEQSAETYKVRCEFVERLSISNKST